jgi:diadenosine tetraphosphate (Ap4A) HIT family hydrolase
MHRRPPPISWVDIRIGGRSVQKTCELCVLVADLEKRGESHPVGPDWLFNSYRGPGTRPRFVLQSRRHVTSIGALGDAETSTMGRAIGRVARFLMREPGVAKVYVASFNETLPGHPHVHLIPRFEGEIALGPALSDDVDTPAGFDSARVLERVSRAARTDTPLTSSSALVSGARAILRVWNRHLSLYAPLSRLAVRKPRLVPNAGETYVGLWLLVLAVAAGVLIATDVAGPGPAIGTLWVTAIVAGYRLMDMAVYVFNILLTTYRTNLISVARSLLLFMFNLVELTLIGFVLLRAGGLPSTDAIPAALSLTTSMAGIDPDSTPSVIAATVAVNCVTLLVFALGIAMLVGKIGDSFDDLSTSRRR